MILPHITVRLINEKDYISVTDIISENMRIVNSKSYPDSVIDFMCDYYGIENFEERASEFKELFVVEKSDNSEEIIGVGGWKSIPNEQDLGYVSCMFIKISYHSKGVGKLLLTEIEKTAKSNNISRLTLNSSINAENFYQKMGYNSESREELEGFGEGVNMVKKI
ncbi:MAG: GNAT family N-acetyltransferase [archaeon]|nr:GNAT family N-acetyltransferase [archaeon]